MRLPRFHFHLDSLILQLRDPKVQVWLMAGSALLLLVIGHVRAWSGPGEGKNQAHRPAARLLVAGARLDWTESFGPDRKESRRPTLSLNVESPPAPTVHRRPQSTLALGEVRPAMEAAATRPWKHLKRPMRRQLATAGSGPQPLRIQLEWSGGDRGNSAQLEGSWQPSPLDRDRPSAHFVIGNGSRSGDGEIDCLSSSLSLKDGRVVITLIGRGGMPTPDQQEALGELLHHLEALSGHPLLPESTLASPPHPV